MSFFGYKRLKYDKKRGTYNSPIYGTEWNTDGPTPANYITKDRGGIHATYDENDLDNYDGDKFVIEGYGDIIIGNKGWRSGFASPIASIDDEYGSIHFGIPNINNRIAKGLIKNSKKRAERKAYSEWVKNQPPFIPAPISLSSGIAYYDYDRPQLTFGYIFISIIIALITGIIGAITINAAPLGFLVFMILIALRAIKVIL